MKNLKAAGVPCQVCCTNTNMFSNPVKVASSVQSYSTCYNFLTHNEAIAQLILLGFQQSHQAATKQLGIKKVSNYRSVPTGRFPVPVKLGIGRRSPTRWRLSTSDGRVAEQERVQ